MQNDNVKLRGNHVALRNVELRGNHVALRNAKFQSIPPKAGYQNFTF